MIMANNLSDKDRLENMIIYLSNLNQFLLMKNKKTKLDDHILDAALAYVLYRIGFESISISKEAKSKLQKIQWAVLYSLKVDRISSNNYIQALNYFNEFEGTDWVETYKKVIMDYLYPQQYLKKKENPSLEHIRKSNSVWTVKKK
jgi:uncharacterized protein with HEPN domain